MNTAPATDWEQVFEDPESGLIARIQMAKDSANLSDICCTLVEKLYTRRGDARLRDRYRDRITAIFDADKPTEDKLSETIAILREIKHDRIVRAGKKRKPRSWAQTLREHEDGATQLFTDHVLGELQSVFDLLSDGIKPLPKRPLPYFVSPAFGAHFKEIVTNEFMPELITYNQRVISATESLHPNEREAALKQTFEEVRFRERFSDAWKMVWRNLTEQQEPPEKPARKKRNIMKSLVSQFMEEPEFDDSMTLEEWQEAVALTEKRNKQAEVTWAKIALPSDAYAAPTRDDHTFLGSLIVHPYEETQKSIAKLTQMASQKAPPTAFNKFQDGKDIDLALLLASMRYPKLFLVGEDAYLKDVMRGFNARDRRFAFPRVDQYLLSDTAG